MLYDWSMASKLDLVPAKVRSLLTENLDSAGNPLPDALKEAALELVLARRDFFTNNEGLPDLKGTSWGYRKWVSENVLNGIEPKVAQRLRYHVGNLLRNPEIIPPEQLAEAGLLKESPQERSHNVNKEIGNLANLLKGRGTISPEEIPDALNIIQDLFFRMNSTEGRSEVERLAPGLWDHIERFSNAFLDSGNYARAIGPKPRFPRYNR